MCIRDRRMAKAKEEAKVEIAKFRQDEEEALKQQIEKEYGFKNETSDMEMETEKQIEEFKKMFEVNKEKVVELLISNITSVDLELPMVIKGIFETNQVIASNFYKLTELISPQIDISKTVSYTHLRAHETSLHLVCRLLLEKKKKNTNKPDV
eukprot:TRINITY_DN43302_c0_g1_i5.p2 TRINITY_DN43302_c0_g1~~TRINITY_DN43302_c0_g1_i5.p2  ORF type:complete len:152 (+),score=48.99 TRINITY_DN43302_c0_g1_i5:184-639(+)